MNFVIIGVLVVLAMGGIAGAYKLGGDNMDRAWKLKQAEATNAKNVALKTVMDVWSGRRAKSEAMSMEVGADIKALIEQIPESDSVSCPDVPSPPPRLVFVDPPKEGVIPGPMAVLEPRVETRIETRTKIVKVGCDYPAEIRQKLNSLQVRR